MPLASMVNPSRVEWSPSWIAPARHGVDGCRPTTGTRDPARILRSLQNFTASHRLVRDNRTRQCSHTGSDAKRLLRDARASFRSLSTSASARPWDTVCSVISETRPGDRLRLVSRSAGWFREDAPGLAVVRMASAWQPPANEELRGAQIRGIYEWQGDGKASPEHRQPNCERWEVVRPEFLWQRSGARTNPS